MKAVAVISLVVVKIVLVVVVVVAVRKGRRQGKEIEAQAQIKQANMKEGRRGQQRKRIAA